VARDTCWRSSNAERRLLRSTAGGEVCGDEVMAAAQIDRLSHNCHILTIRGNSYRLGQCAELYAMLRRPQPATSKCRAPAQEVTTLTRPAVLRAQPAKAASVTSAVGNGHLCRLPARRQPCRPRKAVRLIRGGRRGVPQDSWCVFLRPPSGAAAD
jgi:hypothetical protein